MNIRLNSEFGDRISWENHIKELPLDDESKLFHKYSKDSDIIRHIHNYKQSGRLLDCGCHVGRWSRYFTEAGFDYTGIDQSLLALQYAKIYNPKTKFIHEFLWNMKFNEDKKFDIAITIAVLQHNTLDEKIKIIPRIYDSLKKDGIFFITESTVDKETKTQLTHQGWIKLVESFGFSLLTTWHLNELNLNDHYIFRKI